MKRHEPTTMTHPAPIVQLMLTLQFDPPAAGLTILDWADLRALFAAELPVFTQVARAGAMPATIEQTAFDVPFGTPRLHMASSDLSEMVMLQDDRVSVGWNRVASLFEDPAYPGFTATLERAKATFETVFKFLDSRSIDQVRPTTGEVAYTDVFITHQNEVQVRRLEDIFFCVRSIDQFRFSQVSLSYRKPLAIELGDEFDGIIETGITGLTPTAEGQLAANLQTVVRFVIADGSLPSIEDRFNLAHRQAQIVYSTLVKPDASAILETI